MIRDLERVRAQGLLPFDVGIVGVLRGQVANGRFALHLHVVLVVVHLERRFGGLGHAPHDNGRDLDRITLVIVDLDLRAFEVPDPQRHALAAEQGIRPVEAVRLHRAGVLAEELKHAGFVGIDREAPEEHEGREGQEHHVAGDRPSSRRRHRGRFRDEPVDQCGNGGEEQRNHEPAGQRRSNSLSNHDGLPTLMRLQSDITLKSYTSRGDFYR